MMPNCTACEEDFHHNETGGSCFLCAPGCLNCTDDPEVCGACEPPLVYVENFENGEIVGRCIIDEYCWDNCAVCNGTEMVRMAEQFGQHIPEEQLALIVQCIECFNGSFLYMGECYECTFGCGHCEVNVTEIFMEEVAPFWMNFFQTLMAQMPPGSPPPMLFNPQNMSEQEIELWGTAFFLLKFVMDENPNIDHFQIVLQAMNSL